MKMNVDISVNSCPYCEEWLENEIYQHFIDSDYSKELEFTCPHCKKEFDIEVEAIPTFNCSAKGVAK